MTVKITQFNPKAEFLKLWSFRISLYQKYLTNPSPDIVLETFLIPSFHGVNMNGTYCLEPYAVSQI
jgi:hypothetical protein